MDRRGTSTWVGGFLVVLLGSLAALLPVPYARLSPGPTADALGAVDGDPLISIEGRETFPTEGRLDLTTVSVLGGPGTRVDLLSALQGWVDPDVAVVPVEQVFPPGTTQQQVEQRNVVEMTTSQEAAKAAALDALDVPVESVVTVQAVSAGAPAEGVLEVGDVIVSVDGEPVTTDQQVRDLVTDREPGEPVQVTVERDGERRELTVPTEAAPDGRPVVGVVPVPSYEFPFEIDIALEDVGGPSAGLVFALGIVDKVTPGSLVGGRYVAGTGTIDPEGEVGAIGGIQQKVAAADELGADAGDLELIRVETLEGALDALEVLRTGEGELPTCEAARAAG